MTVDMDKIVTKTVSGAKIVADKAAKTATAAFDYTKTQIDRAAIRDKIKDQYRELGKLSYSAYSTGANNNAEIRCSYKTLDELFEHLKSTDKVIKPKGKICGFCSASNQESNIYCSKCGERL
jgi:hypothetical protein